MVKNIAIKLLFAASSMALNLPAHAQKSCSDMSKAELLAGTPCTLTGNPFGYYPPTAKHEANIVEVWAALKQNAAVLSKRFGAAKPAKATGQKNASEKLPVLSSNQKAAPTSPDNSGRPRPQAHTNQYSDARP